MSQPDVPVDPTIDPDLDEPHRRPPTDLDQPQDRQIVGELIMEEVTDDEEEVTELTPQERSDFATLLTCGRRSKRISVMGHSVVIQTLKTGDEMRIGLYTKPYLESQLGFQRAYQVAVVAAGVREIQGKPLFRELSPVTDEDEIFDRKAEAAKEYYPVVITQIYQAIMDLEREFAQLAIKLGKLKG